MADGNGAGSCVGHLLVDRLLLSALLVVHDYSTQYGPSWVSGKPLRFQAHAHNDGRGILCEY